MPKPGKLHRAALLLTKRFAPKGVILLYHRVAELLSDPQLLCVTPQHFAEQVEVLRQVGHPTSLRQLALALRDGWLPRWGVAVTFDDGYADNLHNARPLLERYGIPGTVFVASGSLDESREFWWDELDRLLLQPGTVPGTLHLTINGSIRHWELGAAVRYTEDAAREHRRWNVLEQVDPTPRQEIYRSLCRCLRPLPVEERRKVLEDVRRWAGADPACRTTHRPLSVAEVTRLVRGELIDVGAHTVNHPVLSSLPAGEQRREIRTSKAHLEDILGRPVASFAYPYGTRSDYTEETMAIVRESGFACACSNVPDAIWKDADGFQLPRIVIRDWDGEEFARRLTGWLRG